MARITEEQAQQLSTSSSGEWFSLKNDKDVARVQFVANSIEEIPTFSVHRVKMMNSEGKETERMVDCLRSGPSDPLENCPFCDAGMAPKPSRFVVMYQHDDGKIKIWERGKQFIGKLQSLMNRYSPFSDMVFEIERHGKTGDKETKYEIFPMDRIDPINLDEVEIPEIEGGLVMQKSEEEMYIFLETGFFPKNDDADQAPVTRRGNVPTQPAAATPSRRGAPASQPAQQESRGTRRASPAPEVDAPRASRSSSRAGSTNKEVF